MTTIEIIKNKTNQLYTEIAGIQRESIAAVENGGIIDAELVKASQRINAAIEAAFGEGADDSYLVYIQGLLVMAEKFASTPYGDIIKGHLIEVVSETPEILVKRTSVVSTTTTTETYDPERDYSEKREKVEK